MHCNIYASIDLPDIDNISSYLTGRNIVMDHEDFHNTIIITVALLANTMKCYTVVSLTDSEDMPMRQQKVNILTGGKMTCNLNQFLSPFLTSIPPNSLYI